MDKECYTMIIALELVPALPNNDFVVAVVSSSVGPFHQQVITYILQGFVIILGSVLLFNEVRLAYYCLKGK